MKKWTTYIRERFPIHTFTALAGGIALSGIYLDKRAFQGLPFILSLIGILFFFALQRLIEDLRNVDRDRIAYKDRSLPKGLIKKEEALQAIRLGKIFLLAYSMAVWVFLQQTAALAYVCIVFYLWLLSKDIFKTPSRWPLFSGIFEMLFVFPVAIFAAAAVNPNAFSSTAAWSFAAMMFGAFFTYRICRHLDPHTHPILGTYVHYYGFHGAFELAMIMLATSAMGSFMLGLLPILLPCEIIVGVALCLLFFQPAWFRLPELAASLSLMAHAWAVVIDRFFHR